MCDHRHKDGGPSFIGIKMTCIIGMVNEGKVYIGGDSAGVSGYSIQIRGDVKVFRNGPFVMGFTSSFRMGQLLQYVFEPPAHPEGMEDMKYMVSVFIPAIRECFKNGGFQKSKDSQDHGGSFIVGYKGRMYEVEGDYQVAIVTDNITAIGCGSDIALGSMHSLGHLYPKERIKKALEIVVHLNSGVRPPFVIEEL
jgi:ATP-dependent protease HslVU (ClpYQ) peptidase subunit